MKRVYPMMMWLVVAGCSGTTGALKHNPANETRYLDKQELGLVIAEVRNLRFPLSRAEALTQLGVIDHNLPSTQSHDPMRPSCAQELITLTDPAANGQRFRLLLWYEPGESVTPEKQNDERQEVRYAELVLDDDGSGATPKGTFVLR